MPMDAAEAARVLSYPTRAEIYRCIVEAGKPVGVAELRTKLGLSHTAVRQHVAALRAAGLVAEQVERRVTAGRPRVLYHALATTAGGPCAGAGPTPGELEDPYERLATLLAEVARRGVPPEDVGREAGAADARAVPPGAEPVAALVRRLEAMGFSPVAASDDGHHFLVATRCPWAAVAAVAPEVVCSLHRGYVAGLLSALGGPELERFSPHHAARAGCEALLSPRETVREAR